MMPLSSCSIASKTENKPLYSSGAGHGDHGGGRCACSLRRCTACCNCVMGPVHWRWGIQQGTADCVIQRRVHDNLVLALGEFGDAPIYHVLGDVKSVEVHRAIALPLVRISRSCLTPNPEPELRACASKSARTCAAEDDLFGASSKRWRGEGNRYREQQRHDHRG